MADKPTIEEWIAELAGPQRQVVERVKDLVAEAAPDAVASIKWGQPVWERNGPFGYVKAFPSSVNVGFWRGADLDDPDRLLSGDGDRMRHLKLLPANRSPRRRFADGCRRRSR